MITNINYNRIYISFKNSDSKTICFNAPKYYEEIFCFLQIDDGIICVLATRDDTPDEEKRRNVVKIDEDGKIVWVVMDRLDDYKKRFPGDNEILEQKKRAGFNSIGTYGNKIVLGSAEPDYFLDPKTGAIEFWKAERF